jgi:two-component system OmpR family response regulator
MAGGLNKILYVEDDPIVAELAGMVLTTFGGFGVRHCASGVDAIAAFPEFAPQMLLLDLMMPEMDGPQTLQNIRSMPGGDAVPAVFMTARV